MNDLKKEIGIQYYLTEILQELSRVTVASRLVITDAVTLMKQAEAEQTYRTQERD